MRPLQGSDAIILDYLLRVTAIVERRNIGTKADVHRIANTWLRPGALRTTQPKPPAPKPLAPPKRYKPRKPAPAGYNIPQGPPRLVELTERQTVIFDHMRAGHHQSDIAAQLNIHPNTVGNQMTLIARSIGGVDRIHAIKLVEAGAVTIHTKRAA